MSVKLEVGAWYQGKCGMFKDEYLQYTGGDNPHLKGFPGFYAPSKNEIWSFGEHPLKDWLCETPYHIEPGDRVRPKPAGDKCWEDGRGNGRGDTKEFIVSSVKNVRGDPFSMGSAETSGGLWNSCLILLEKWEHLTVGKTYKIKQKSPYDMNDEVAIERDDEDRCRTRHKSEFKLIRRAGEIKAENTTRIWIRPGHGHAFPTAMGFDCEPLNRCIPCIECHTEDYRQTIDNFTKFKRSLEPKKLTQLKGRL